ncbi:MAG: hypothetical protein ACK559_27335, partial [bacterium]
PEGRVGRGHARAVAGEHAARGREPGREAAVERGPVEAVGHEPHVALARGRPDREELAGRALRQPGRVLERRDVEREDVAREPRVGEHDRARVGGVVQVDGGGGPGHARVYLGRSSRAPHADTPRRGPIPALLP